MTAFELAKTNGIKDYIMENIQTALMKASGKGDLDVVNNIITHYGDSIDINAKNEVGVVIICYADILF